MKRLLTAIFLLSSTSTYAEPERLGQLRANYEAAVERATSPLQRVYLEELEKLKAEYTREAKLEDALAVEEELKELTGPFSSKIRQGIVATLVASPWRGEEGMVLTFKKDGTALWNGGSNTGSTDCTW